MRKYIQICTYIHKVDTYLCTYLWPSRDKIFEKHHVLTAILLFSALYCQGEIHLGHSAKNTAVLPMNCVVSRLYLYFYTFLFKFFKWGCCAFYYMYLIYAWWTLNNFEEHIFSYVKILQKHLKQSEYRWCVYAKVHTNTYIHKVGTYSQNLVKNFLPHCYLMKNS